MRADGVRYGYQKRPGTQRGPQPWPVAKGLAQPEGRRDTALAMSEENMEVVRELFDAVA